MSNPDLDARMASIHSYLQKQKEILDAMDPDEVWHAEAGSLKAMTSMDYWWPTVSRIAPVPLTVQVPVPERCNLFRLLDGEEPLHWGEFFDQLMSAVRLVRTALPETSAVFLRTSYTSGKHEWRDTCFLDSIDPEDVRHHVESIVNLSALIDQPVDGFWVREMVETVPVFRAFGGMPITREYRFRVVDGRVTHVQPYWPAEAFEFEPGDCWDRIPEDWEDLLRASWRIGCGELARLERMTESIGGELGGDWSVDWLQRSSGDWICTDLAAGHLSFWWDAAPEDFIVEDGEDA